MPYIKYIFSVSLIMWLCSCQIQSTSNKIGSSDSNQNSVRQNPAGSDQEYLSEKTAAIEPPKTIKLLKHEVWDREGTGVVALTYLLPASWTVNEKLFWNYNDLYVPVRYSGKFKSNDGGLSIEQFPDISAIYTEGPGGRQGNPPPSSLLAALKEMIQYYRPGLNMSFIEQKILPKTGTSNAYGMNTQTKTENGFVRVAYQENGQPMEEEFYGSMSIMDMVSHGTVTLRTVNWGVNGVYACKAPKGSLEECRKIALTVQSSARLTLPFYNRVAQVAQLLQDQNYQQIYRAGQLSRIISQTNDAVSKTISDSYWNAQKTNEKNAEQFSDNLRGVERYSDGSGTQTQLPSGYAEAWVNNRGEYLMADGRGYDPNTTTGETWTQLRKK